MLGSSPSKTISNVSLGAMPGSGGGGRGGGLGGLGGEGGGGGGEYGMALKNTDTDGGVTTPSSSNVK